MTIKISTLCNREFKFYSSEFTAQQIIEKYDDGCTVRELVREFKCSESRIRQILREKMSENEIEL